MEAAWLMPVIELCGCTGILQAEAMAAMRSASVTPPHLDRSGCQTRDDPVLQQAGELEAREVVLAGRERRAAEAAGLRVAEVVMRGEGLLEPADAQRVHRRHDAPHIVDPVPGIGVGQDGELRRRRPRAPPPSARCRPRTVSPMRSFTAR